MATELPSKFPESATRALLEGAHERHFDVGEIVYRGGGQEAEAPVYLVIEGLVRVHVRSSIGREITVRYASAADVIGLPTLVAGRSNRRLAVQAMADATLLRLSGDTLRRLAAREVAVAWPIARYLAHIVHLSEELWSAPTCSSRSAPGSPVTCSTCRSASLVGSSSTSRKTI